MQGTSSPSSLACRIASPRPGRRCFIPHLAFILLLQAGCGILNATCNEPCKMTCVEDDQGPYYTCVSEACTKTQPIVSYKIADPSKCESPTPRTGTPRPSPSSRF